MLDESSNLDSEPVTGEIPLVFAAENKPQTRRSIFSRSAIYPHTIRAISAEAASELQAHRRNRSNPLDATLRLLEDFTDHSADQLYTDSNLVEGRLFCCCSHPPAAARHSPPCSPRARQPSKPAR